MLTLGNCRLVALLVYPQVAVIAGPDSIQFAEHAEIGTVCSQEHIARHRLQHCEGALEIRRYSGIGGGTARQVHQTIAWIDVPAPDDHDVERLAMLAHLHRPGGTAARVTRRAVRDQ